MEGTLFETARFAAAALTLSLGFFAAHYGFKAPWWRSLEGRIIFLSYTMFTLTMANLVIFLYTGWPGYRVGQIVTMGVTTIVVVHQNALLFQVRADVRKKRDDGEVSPLPEGDQT